MVEQSVTSDHTWRVEAGKRLLESLRSIRIEPDVLCWSESDDGPELVLITSLVDRVGPLAIYNLLWKARDNRAIPEDTPLMDLALYSPRSEMGHDLMRMLLAVGPRGHVTNPTGGQDFEVERTWFTQAGTDPLDIPGDLIFAVRSSGFSATDDLRRWRNAEKVVARMAA